MRLTLVISTLACGGAERVMTILANAWAAQGREITLLTFDDGSRPPFYELDDRVNHRALGLASPSTNQVSGLLSNLRRTGRLRRAICQSRPDAVISFMDKTNVVTLLATRGLRVPVIVAEHTDPTHYRIGRVWEQLRRWTYTFADQIIVLSKAAFDYFPLALQARARIIPNPVLQPMIGAQVKTPLGKPSLVAMGRLSQEKGFDLLLHAFARVKDQHPAWALTILGEGPWRAELEALRDRLGLAGRVHLPGRLSQPHAVLAQGDIFVMPSRFEGFPMALCEAMACGLPVICSDCSGGISEIVTDGSDGLLFPNEDVSAMATALNRLMSNEAERKRLAARAPDVIERFSLARVMRLWAEALEHADRNKAFSETASVEDLG